MLLLQHFARFRRWFVARSPLWTQLRVAGVAVRTSDGWIARRVLVTVGAPMFSDRVLQTEHVIIFERHCSLTLLPHVLLQFVHGRLPPQLELGVPVRVFSFPPSSVGSDEQPARTGFVFRPVERFARFELKMSGDGSQAGGSAFTQELHEQCDREMRAEGQGRLGEVLRALGVTNNDDELCPGGNVKRIVNVVACVPARISAFTQTADRTQAVVTTEIGPEFADRVTLLMTELNDGGGFCSRGDLTRTAAPCSPCLRRTTSSSLSCSTNTQPSVNDSSVWPVPAPGCVTARSPGSKGRIVDSFAMGCSSVERPTGTPLTRSVIHLFGLLGFSGFGG